MQFIVGGCLFGGGVFLFMNQVMVRSDGLALGLRRSFGGMAGGWRGWGSGSGLLPGFGTPGMGLLMIPLAIGVCLLFAGRYQRWARLLVWGSLAALFVGVLNSVRITLMPATLWQLAVYVVMIASGGGLMFRSLSGYADDNGPRSSGGPDPRGDEADLRLELTELRRRLESLER
ncbi:MAG: hypothetical protein KFB97_07340 [Cyanobium sp. M30B3]|nr:MAG: hypothetical protein KFB97_07340 [Cyanobium sp. M30B3]